MKRWVKILILAYLSFLFFGSFFAIGLLWIGALEDTFPFISDIEIFLYYFLAGSIGGSLRHLYMFCSHYRKDELSNYRDWVMYIFYPIFATGTAVIAVTLVQSGILLIEFTNNVDGPYGQISLAFFVGFGFNRFLNKLNEVSKEVFEAKEEEQTQKSTEIKQ
ncbi:hypothetical protein [Ferdinandcohnia sp. Marseille-Q9671]